MTCKQLTGNADGLLAQAYSVKDEANGKFDE
jgi:hypothetical protein